MSETNFPSMPNQRLVPGYVCPFCATDCSPIAGEICTHLFIVDGENGWRFTTVSRSLSDAASLKAPPLFRDLLYHNPECRAWLKLQRANYDDSLEIYVFSENPQATAAAFEKAISAA